jgi:hypothetical protein
MARSEASPTTLTDDRTQDAVNAAAAVGAPLRHVSAGDVLYFVRKDVHALVFEAGSLDAPANEGDLYPETVDLKWLDGYRMESVDRGISADVLARMGEQNTVRVVDSDVAENKRATGRRRPEWSARDGSVVPAPRTSVDTLRFTRTRSRDRVNAFLKSPVVDHKQDRIQKARAMFTAERPDGRPAAVLTVSSPTARNAFDRRTVEISRYASHPETEGHGTNNTATWMLSRACRWAALEGYERVRTLAGTAGNDGGIYRAANFRFDGVADTDGNHDREGRSNHNHDKRLKRFVREIDADGGSGELGVPRRFDARLAGNTATDGGMTSLSEFGESAALTPANMALTREEASDTKFTRSGDSDQYAAFSPRVRDLDTDDKLAGLEAARGKLPAAVFGADVDGTLAAAVVVSGDPDAAVPVATVDAYLARETEYPDATARWLLSRAREWANLDGYQSLRAPHGTFSSVEAVNPTVPKGVGFEADTTAKPGHRAAF